MATTTHTLNAHPDKVEALREIKRENDLKSLDEALGEVLSRAGVQ